MNPQPNPLAAHYALTAARFAFNNGDYQAALTLADEALLLSPRLRCSCGCCAIKAMPTVR